MKGRPLITRHHLTPRYYVGGNGISLLLPTDTYYYCSHSHCKYLLYINMYVVTNIEHSYTHDTHACTYSVCVLYFKYVVINIRPSYIHGTHACICTYIHMFYTTGDGTTTLHVIRV